MSIRDDFFAAQGKAALWDVAVSIKRGNPLPLDASSIFKSYADLEAYIADGESVAYPGQLVAVVGVESTDIYYLDQELAIQPVGVIPTGEGAINVTDDGVISVNVDDETVKIVDGKLTAIIPEFEDTDTTYSVAEGEKVLKLEGTEFSTELGLKHEDGKISLTGINGEVIAEFSDAEFVADGVLEDVSYNDETKDLTFTWNIVVGKDDEGNDVYKTDIVNIADLVDLNTDTTYTIGAGVPEEEEDTKKVQVTLTPSEGKVQKATIDAYNTTTMDDMLYNGQYTKKTKNDDGTTKEELVVSNITANKDKARLISTEEIAKLSALVLSDDGSVGVSGTISAENVTGLGDAITSQVTGANALNIEAGAQKNVIEEIKVNGEKIAPVNKVVDIAIPTKVSEFENDRGYITNVRVPETVVDGEGQTSYKSMLLVRPSTEATSEKPVLIVDDSAIQTAIKGLAADATNHKVKQTAIEKLGSTVKTITKVTQNENGEVDVTYENIAFPTPDLSGKKDKQGAVENKITDPAHVLTSLTQNENGELSYDVKKLTPADIGAQPVGDYQPAGNYKIKQDTKDDPTAEEFTGTILNYIDSLTQNENGEITATKKSFDIAGYIQEEIGKTTNIMNFRGVIDTAAEGFDEKNPFAQIDNPENGDVVLYDAFEYIYDGKEWKEFGDATGSIATAKAYTDEKIAEVHTVDNDTIKLNEDNKAYVAKVSTDVLVQGEQELVLCGGNAFGFASN